MDDNFMQHFGEKKSIMENLKMRSRLTVGVDWLRN